MDFSSIITPFLTALETALPVILGGGFVVGMIYWLSTNSASAFAQYKGLVIAAVRQVETMEANAAPGTIGSKVEAFAKAFDSLYTSTTGATPSAALTAWATAVKEEVLLDLEKANLTNSSPTGAVSVDVTHNVVPPVVVTVPPVTPPVTPA